ncbi:MAG: Rv0909 family putative TA system antitoxin [Corynebacterium sp.]|nr:Rv0909 family putative TA system antitoxin [Corynebacterium sp.]
MGIFDKAKQKAQEALKSESVTDSVLDKAEQAATNKFGADKSGHISKARQVIDDKIGDGNTGTTQ